MSEQRDFFRDVERAYWADAEGLKEEEEALIGRYLAPALKTVDAGTGGGRIARALVASGFADVSGYDFTPELIDAAREADPEGRIDWLVADATRLPYGDGRFDQALYLQQVVCTIDDTAGRTAALSEAARILKPGGKALFSFVCFESRLASSAQRAYVAYLRSWRALRRDKRPIQSMPRLRLSGKKRDAAAGALRDRGPYNWWYRADEAEAALHGAGFEIEGAAFGPALVAGRVAKSAAEALEEGAGGTLYVACRRGISAR